MNELHTLYWAAAVVAAGAIGFSLGRMTVGPNRIRFDTNLLGPNILTRHVTIWRGRDVLFHASRARGYWRRTPNRFLNRSTAGAPQGCVCDAIERMVGDFVPGCPHHFPAPKMELVK